MTATPIIVTSIPINIIMLYFYGIRITGGYIMKIKKIMAIIISSIICILVVWNFSDLTANVKLFLQIIDKK